MIKAARARASYIYETIRSSSISEFKAQLEVVRIQNFQIPGSTTPSYRRGAVTNLLTMLSLLAFEATMTHTQGSAITAQLSYHFIVYFFINLKNKKNISLRLLFFSKQFSKEEKRKPPAHVTSAYTRSALNGDVHGEVHWVRVESARKQCMPQFYASKPRGSSECQKCTVWYVYSHQQIYNQTKFA